MQSVLNVEVSSFNSYQDNVPKTINLLEWLQSDQYASQIEKLRNTSNKSKRDQLKAKLPAITVSGIFSPTRKEDNLVKHSKLICIDIDQKDNEHITNFSDLKQELFKIKNVAYISLSASGRGYFLIIPIRYPKRHRAQFQALKYDLELFGLKIDSAPQNVASLRGYSYDPEALIRHDAIPYRKWGKPKLPDLPKSLSLPFYPQQDADDTQKRVEELIAIIVARRIDITQHEPDWFRLACAFANEFGEGGREYFHQISQFYSGYNKALADQKYDHVLRRKYNFIGIGSFFKLVSSAI